MSMIQEFFGSIIPSFDRTRLIDTVSSTREMLTNETLPMYTECVEFKGFPGVQPFKSNQMKNFNKIFMREVNPRMNFIEGTAQVFTNLTNDFAVLSEAVEKHFAQRHNPKLALTYQHLTFLRMIELVRFASRYARRMLNYMYMYETPATFSRVATNGQMPKGEVKWLEANMMGYCRTMHLLSKRMTDILREIQSMPDTVYNPEAEDAVGAVVGARKMDPLGLGYIPIISTAIWAIGSRWVDYQAAELLEARQERELVQLRLAQYKAAQQGNFDAAAEKVIKVNEERLNELTYKIVKLSERYGVEADL